VRQRRRDQDVDGAAGSSVRLRGRQQTIEQCQRVRSSPAVAIMPSSGKERPGDPDVRELARVVEVVISRQFLSARPGERLLQPVLGKPQPRLKPADRPNLGHRAAQVESLRLLQQFRGAIKVALGLSQSSQRTAAPGGRLWQWRFAPEVFGQQQVRHRRIL
jgi:hypothetical protein